MSELVLKITADQTGLQQVKAATEELRAVLTTGLSVSTKDISELTSALIGLSAQSAKVNQDVKSVAASLTAVAGEARNAEQATSLAKASFSQLALSTDGLSKALTLQKKETLSTIAAMADMDRYLKSQAQNTLALVGVKELLNKEFAKQISLRTLEAADKDGQLAKERQHTAALAEQLAIKNLISQADLRSIRTAATAGTPSAIALENKAAEARAAIALASETASLEKGMEDMRTTAVRAGVEKRLALQRAYAKSVMTLAEETLSLEKGMEGMRTAAVAAGVEKRLALQRSSATSSIALWRETASLEKGFEDMRTAAVAAGVTQRLNLQRSAATQAVALAEETFALEKGLENMRTAAVAAGVEKRKLLLRAAAKDAILTAELSALPTSTVSPQSIAALRQTALSAANAAASLGAMSKAEVEAAAASMGLASSLTSRLNPAMSSATTHSTTLRDSIRGVAGASGGLWMAYGQLLPMMAGFATAAGTIKGVKLSAEFEHITVATDTVAKANGDLSLSLVNLREKLLAVKNVEHTPAELGGAVKDLVKAGFSEKQAAAEIGDMSKTATVAQEELSVVTKGVASQYRAWNDEIVGTERGLSSLKQASNMMAYVANATATDFGELNKALAYTPALAQLSKISFAEMTAAVGMLSNVGVTGTMGATALQTSIVRLQNPTKELTKLLEHNKIAYSAFNADGTIKTFTQQFEDLSKALEGLSDKSRSQVLAELFGLRGVKSGIPMVNELSEAIGKGSLKYRELVESATEAGQSMTYVEDSAKRMMDTTQGQWDLFKADLARTFTESFNDQGAVRGLTDALREAAADGSLRSIVDGLALVAKGILNATAFLVEHKGLVLTLLGAWGFSKLVSGLTSVATAIGAVTFAQTASNTAAAMGADGFFKLAPMAKAATAEVGLLTAAQATFNRTVLLNFYVAAGAIVIWGASKALDALRELTAEQIRFNNAANGNNQSTLGGTGVRTMGPTKGALSKAPDQIDRADAGSSDPFQRALAGEQTGVIPRGQTFEGLAAKKPWWQAGTDIATAKGSNWKPDRTSQNGEITLEDPQEVARLAREEEARKRKEDIATKNAEWYAQRKLQIQDLEASLLAQKQQASYARELSLADAYHKAGLSSTSEYVKQKEKLWYDSNASQASAASESIINLEAQLLELERASKATNDDSKRREMDQKAAALSDNIKREKAALGELEKARSTRPFLFEKEEVARNYEYAKSLRSITDAAEELIESSQIEATLSSANEGAAKLTRDLVKIERDRQKGYQGLGDSGNLDDDTYAQMKNAYDKQVAAAKKAYSIDQALRQDWKSGAKKAFADYAYAAEDTFGATERIVGNTFKNAEDALVQFAKTGKLSFRSLIDTLIADLLRFSVARTIAGLGTSLFNAVGGSATSGFSAASSFSGAVADVPYSAHAKGAAFEGISGISNQVLTSPTFFSHSGIMPLAAGAAVAGEAGYEAVMPLERDSQGRLGVIATNPIANNQTSPAVVNHNAITVHVPVDTPKDQANAQAFGKTVSRMIEDKMMALLVKQQAPGGLLYGR